eukprot:UN2178
MWDDTIDGSFHARLYRQFHKDVKNNQAMQDRVFEASSSHGMPLFFQFWPEEKQKDPAVRAQFLDKCNDATKMYLLKAFPREVRGDTRVLRSFIEKTGEKHIYEVYSEFPEAAKENLELVYACIDKVATDFWVEYLFKAFPDGVDGVKRADAVRQRCQMRCPRAQLQLPQHHPLPPWTCDRYARWWSPHRHPLVLSLSDTMAGPDTEASSSSRN